MDRLLVFQGEDKGKWRLRPQEAEAWSEGEQGGWSMCVSVCVRACLCACAREHTQPPFQVVAKPISVCPLH